ncbi:MAG: DNA-3-methyladenine glycosylase [Bacteroidota bacterium]
MKNNKLPNEFFQRDVLQVAPEMLGKMLVRKFSDGTIERFTITEVEAYSGNGDRACHASRGKTPRTGVMFREGGLVYVYLVYGIHWLLNIVTGKNDDASAVLIRGIEGVPGPGRVGKKLQLDKSFYAEDLADSTRIWIENADTTVQYKTAPRVGIDYAGNHWASKPWRFILME